MPRARRGLWRRERAGIDASSMTVKPACNGKSRRKSWSMLLEWPPALHHTRGICKIFRPRSLPFSNASRDLLRTKTGS